MEKVFGGLNLLFSHANRPTSLAKLLGTSRNLSKQIQEVRPDLFNSSGNVPDDHTFPNFENKPIVRPVCNACITSRLKPNVRSALTNPTVDKGNQVCQELWDIHPMLSMHSEVLVMMHSNSL